MKSERCRLCQSLEVAFMSRVKTGVFYRCERCGFIQKDKNSVLTPLEERRRYLMHENSIDDEGYVKFLSRLLDPLTSFLPPRADVLDYGSGLEPVLKKLLELRGFNAYAYDPFFAPIVPEGEFDAVTATEVFEHFMYPRSEIEVIVSYLRSGGLLGIETLRYNSDIDFPNWHYIQDPTHIGFFSDMTFAWIENTFGLEKVYDDGERVLILKKK